MPRLLIRSQWCFNLDHYAILEEQRYLVYVLAAASGKRRLSKVLEKPWTYMRVLPKDCGKMELKLKFILMHEALKLMHFSILIFHGCCKDSLCINYKIIELFFFTPQQATLLAKEARASCLTSAHALWNLPRPIQRKAHSCSSAVCDGFQNMGYKTSQESPEVWGSGGLNKMVALKPVFRVS